MDGGSANKSISLETLVIQNTTNVTELKEKLNDIIKIGKDYDYDVSSCLKSLVNSSDPEIVCLTLQAIAELSKCETKRFTYANEEIIEPVLKILQKDVTSDTVEIMKQACRALGNLCCDCDAGRKVILDASGVTILKTWLMKAIDDKTTSLEEIKLFTCKIILNFTIGGQEMSKAVVDNRIIDLLQVILKLELGKVDMNDEVVSTVLLILSVINDNTPEFLFSSDINCLVLNVLRETSNVEISELCLDHLHMQAEHDSVKTLLASQGGVQLVCSRLELLLARRVEADLSADEDEVEAIMKQACDLIIIILTGDDAMNLLYNNGVGEVYLTMIKWLESTNYNLLTTAVLAIGNFARSDTYCIQMMDDKIFDKLLDIFEVYQGFAVRMQSEPDKMHPIDEGTVTKIQHAVVSALRNLSVPVANKRVAAAAGRAAPLMIDTLTHVKDHHVAYKLLAAIRMLVDGQESVARRLASDPLALAAVSRWGRAGESAGPAGEAPRLLAWTVRQLRHQPQWRHIVQVDGCICCLVNMLVSSHSVMQNEALLALTLLAIESLNNKLTPQTEQPTEFDYEKSFITQIIETEIGKHISVLIETNCAKIPIEVAENLLAFLDITAKKNNVAADYKEAKVNEFLQKFADTRKDLSDDLKACIAGVVSLISDNENKE